MESLTKFSFEFDSDSVSANMRLDCTPKHLVQEMISKNEQHLNAKIKKTSKETYIDETKTCQISQVL